MANTILLALLFPGAQAEIILFGQVVEPYRERQSENGLSLEIFLSDCLLSLPSFHEVWLAL